MYNNNVANLSLVAMVIISGLALSALSSNAEAKVKYKKAIYVEQQHCSSRFPANKRYAKSHFNLLKGGCWSCPRGFKRTATPAPDKHKSCNKPRPLTDARFHSDARGVFKNVCKGKPWLKDKKCWTCPKGFKRSNKKRGGRPQCKPRTKYYYHPAAHRGNAGCSTGFWSPLLSGKCYRCPSGYFRNPTRASLDRAKDRKACMTFVKSRKEQATFINKYRHQATKAINEHPELVKLSVEFAKHLQKTIKRKGGINRIGKADIRAAGGVRLLNASCGKGFPSVSVTVGGDASYGLGFNGAGGWAFGLEAECQDTDDGNDWIDRNTDFGIKGLVTINGSIGPSAGGDASINVGFWKVPYNKLGGFAHGIVLGGSYAQYGANGSAWWAIKWGGQKDEYVGFSVGYQGGLSAEAEYNWGYTFQKKH